MGAAADIGLLIRAGRPGAWADALRQATRAEADGAASVWVAGPAGGVPLLAALSQRVGTRLGLLTPVPAPTPLTVLAKQLAGVDVISHGRLEVGLAGTAADVGEAVTVLTGMLGGGPFTYAGRLDAAVAARCLPPAVQRPRPPLWAVGDPAAPPDRAATGTDGWLAVVRCRWERRHEARAAVSDAGPSLVVVEPDGDLA